MEKLNGGKKEFEDNQNQRQRKQKHEDIFSQVLDEMMNEVDAKIFIIIKAKLRLKCKRTNMFIYKLL